ncbi:MAG: ribosome small subunit-dependent GTPase A [Acidimicrobiia bacterium]
MAPAGAAPRRVVRVDGISCLVSDGSVETSATGRPLPSVGDWVAVNDDGEALRVVARLPRRSELARADDRRRQVLAANVDLVFVTVALDRAEPLVDLEAVLAVALAEGSDTVVLLTKGDLASVEGIAATTREIARRAPLVEVVTTSARESVGLEKIRAMLRPNRTAVFLGPSGTGKSSITNALLGSEMMNTKAIRSDGAGRHTTTARRLATVPSGGVLIDIPGLRSYGLADAAEGINRLYSDLEELATQCRFADCQHVDHPGCAIEGAGVDPERVATWRRLTAEALAGRRVRESRAP